MKNFKTKALVGSAAALASNLYGIVSTAFAQVTYTQPISSGDISVNQVVNLIIKLVFGIGILVVIIFLVFYGIKYVTAGDDAKAIEGARKGITGAVIGLIIIILTFVIIRFVATFLGANSNSLFNILPETL